MPESVFLSAVTKATSRDMSLGELVEFAQKLQGAGRADLAAQLYVIWASINPDHPHIYVAHFNRAVLQTDAGDLGGAEAALRAALEVNPQFQPAYINLGGVLERKGAPGEAIALWEQGAGHLAAVTGEAMKYKIMALKQIGRVLMDHQKPAEAEATLLKCLEHDPNQRDAAGQYVPLRLTQCKWPVVTQADPTERKAIMRGIQPLSMAAYTDDPLLQLGSAWLYIKDDVSRGSARRDFDRRHAKIDLSDRRLRVGYVSSDLRDHAVGYLITEFLELHDRSKVEVFAYYCGIPADGPLTQRIQAGVEHWVDIKNLSDDAAAARIAADGIDILVDVNGLTKDARTGVFARRPAPIQVNWLGFPGSMGSPYHQYIIADDWIIPPEHEHYYSETVLRLDCYQANDRRRIVAEERPTREEVGLPPDAFVFCCFNGAQKITRFTFDRWAAVLNRVPNSVLWLLSSSDETDERLRDHAEARGIARDRLIFAPKQANPRHMARYPLADLFLDTSPYGAHTTASDALWMGVPVLTLTGRSFAARVCGSLVRAAGVPELVCDTPEAYVETAVALAENPEQLRSYRDRLEAGRGSCVLFDMDRLVDKLMGLYQTMCETHRLGLTPRPDLRNLDEYLDVGLELDHEGVELLSVDDFEGVYRKGFAERHRLRPIEPDARVWTPVDIAAAEAAIAADAASLEAGAAPELVDRAA
jgi:predicted O-linked N-acetylglucosamine transferase (SPINDLY family)